MSRQKVFQHLWLVSVVAILAISCKLVTLPFQEVTEVKNTAEAIATDVGGLITEVDFEAIITESGGVIETASAEFTEIPPLTGEKPADIPVIEGGEDLFSSAGLVTYTTSKDFQTVVDFYLREMPQNGWTKNEAESSQSEGQATLVFQKGGRKATVVILDVMISVTVSITITGS